MKGYAIRMNRDSIEKAMSALQWKMNLNRITGILSLQFHFFSKRALKWSCKLPTEQSLLEARPAHFEGVLHINLYLN